MVGQQSWWGVEASGASPELHHGDAAGVHLLPAALLEVIFTNLAPVDRARASASCSLWRQLLRASEQYWEHAYSQLWRLPPINLGAAAQQGWQAAFGRRMEQAGSWRGKPQRDTLFGHSVGVRCLALHVDSGMLFSGSMDRTVRAWDLGSGVQLAASRPHAGTVRCLAADCHTVASGSSDHCIRVWSRGGDGKLSLEQRTLLRGHSGPVTALDLTPETLFSGSWDYSVRAWSRPGGIEGAAGGDWACTAALQVDDWVTALAVRPPHLYVACGQEVLVYSVGAGGWQPTRRPVAATCGGAVTAVQGSLDGRLLFFGTGKGAVVGVDLRCDPASGQGHRTLLQDPSGATGLAWEWPCLAASFQRGHVALLDAEVAMAAPGSCGMRGQAAGPWLRWLSAGGGAPASCVALGEGWAAAGLDTGTVATWDFSSALQAQRAAEALKQRKQQARRERAPRGSSKKGGSSLRQQRGEGAASGGE